MVALEVKVLGTITDAEVCERKAVEALWPEVPHQVCQFHALRDASKSAFEADKQVKTAMRKRLQPKLRAVRNETQEALGQGLARRSEASRDARRLRYGIAHSPEHGWASAL